VVWSAPRFGRFTPGIDPVPIVQETGWAPGPVWTCAKNLSTRRKTCPSFIFSTEILACTGLGSNPNVWGNRPATNHLRHGTTLQERNSYDKHLTVRLVPHNGITYTNRLMLQITVGGSIVQLILETRHFGIFRARSHCHWHLLNIQARKRKNYVKSMM
jgi:hypothetical protein